MSESRLRALGWIAGGLIVILNVLALWLLFLNRATDTGPLYGPRGFQLVLTVSFSVVGGIIVWYQPRHIIGWLFYWIGLLSAVQLLTTEYGYLALYTSPEQWPYGLQAAWIQHWIWVLFITPAVIFIPLLFPDGHLLSPRWAIIGWLGVVVTVLLTIAIAFESGPLENFRLIHNPYENTALSGLTDGDEIFVGLPMVFVGILAASSTVVRFRRSTGSERQQIKWLVLAFFLAPIGIGLGGGSDSIWVVMLGIIMVALVPALVGIGILRYQLFDIDLVFNRALVYGLLTIMLGLIYFALVTIIQNLLSAITGQQSTIAIVISTLVIAALFNPLRRRIQNAIDRRFYRRRYDAEKALAVFSLNVREEVDLENLSKALLNVVDETMQPESAAVWLKEGSE